jgi:ACS family sodium-dependent inorganic phosphate cotransporter
MEPSPLAQYWLHAGNWFGHYLPRLALPVIVPLIARDLACTSQQRAMLLSSFFRGYLLTQIVGGLAAQKLGGKLVLSFDLAGLALSFGSLLVAVRSGPRAAALALGSMGLFFGPILSAASINKNNWLPVDGGDRAVAQMIMGTGTKLARISAVSITPVLCGRFGWRFAVKAYGIVSATLVVLWQVLAREAPGPVTAAKLRGEDANSAGVAAKPPPKTFEPQVLKVPQVWSVFAMHIAYNNSDYSVVSWAPTYFVEVLGVPAADVGRYLIWPTGLNMLASYLFGSIEALLLKRQLMTIQGLRRCATAAGTALSALGLLTFGLSRSPSLASLAYCVVALGQGLHHSGFIPNYLEIGGPDIGMVAGLGNTLANLPGVTSPLLAVAMLRRWGSWLPFFVSAAVFEMLCGAWLACVCTTTPARELLLPQRRSRRRRRRRPGAQLAG